MQEAEGLLDIDIPKGMHSSSSSTTSIHFFAPPKKEGKGKTESERIGLISIVLSHINLSIDIFKCLDFVCAHVDALKFSIFWSKKI